MIDVIFNFLLQFDLLIKNNLELSLILYFLFSFLFFTFSLPGSLIIILASSFFFGFITGFIINITTIVLGSLCFFLFFKNIFKKYINKQMEKFSDKLNKIIKKSSFEYLVLLRLIFGVPLFVQNLFLSTLNISKTKFIISSFIGFTPYFLLFSFIGNQFSDLIEVKEFQLSNILSFELILIFIIIIIFLLLRIFLKVK
ncbi:VTT domain-containing protein [Pelagibacteraceae bacterium]|nr:VTT domain-containing protein [Pelagibacteraceae bacterium]